MLLIALGVVSVVLVVVLILLFIEKNTTKTLSGLINECSQKLSTTEQQLQEQLATSAKYQTLYTEQAKSAAEKLELIKKNEQQLQTQFENIATKILDANSAKFSQQTQMSLDAVIKPMQEKFSDFKLTVEKNSRDETKERSALRQELQTLKELNQKISLEAHNLTTALKGNNKTTGSWGEMVLENVLEGSGLRLGHEYIREKVLKNNAGQTYKPDVIVNLPGDRQVIIDAKTSLISYENYVGSEEEADKSLNASLHIKSIDTHIKGLADKEYESLEGVNTLDFIFMFIPIESALMLALEHDKGLFDRAFAKKIVLVSPTTLLIALKAVENSWRYERQAKNTEEVVRLATSLYDKVRGFTEDFEKIGKNLEQANKVYSEAHSKLSSGRGNIIRQIETFKEKSDIKPKKQISKQLLD